MSKDGNNFISLLSATKPIEDTARQPLPRSTSRKVRGNVEQQLRHQIEGQIQKIENLKYDLNGERSAGFERDKDLQRIRKEKAKLREELEETNKMALEQTDF